MFQTDLIHFLQSFESDTLTFLMKGITSLGYEEFFLLLLITIATSVDFRKGFLLIQIMIITGIFTQIGKEFFALPRPWFVDNSLLTFGKNLSTSFSDADANSFFGMLPSNVIEAYRNYGDDSFGLPSGHTSTAVVLWGSLIILFKQKWIKYLSVSLIILVPMSRLYLARHFFADVLAGYLLGLIILIIFYAVIYKANKLKDYLNLNRLQFSATGNDLLLILYLLLLPIVFLIITHEEAVKLSGFLFGINTVYLLICMNAYPAVPQKLSVKIINLILTLIVFALIGTLLALLLNSIFAEEYKLVLFSKSALLIFGGIYISTIINRKVNRRLGN